MEVRDKRSRPKVEAMFPKIIAKADADTKSQITNLLETYHSSFKVELVSLPVHNVATETFRPRGRSSLFTYNWDFFHRPLPDGTRAVADEVEVVASWEQMVLRKVGVAQ